MNKEKMDSIQNFFKDQDIMLPVDVKNSLEDFFMENDDVDSVQCYFREEAEELERDLKIENNIEIYTDGRSRGKTNSIITYYGSMTYSYSEKIMLYGPNDELLDDISNVEDENNSQLDDRDSYTIILHLVTEWDSERKELKQTSELCIYCPISGEEDSDEDKRISEIYNKLHLDIEEGSDGR